MLHLIRQELMEQDYTGPLTGEVEADETWIGGKIREDSADRSRLVARGNDHRDSHSTSV